MGPLPGSHLLAALHASMERIKTVLRICRAAAKPPQLRSNTDISHIMAELQGVPLLLREGPEVLRDLCHVVQTLSLNQMATLRLTGDGKSGALLYVLQGRVQVRTKGSTAGFERLQASGCPDLNSSSGSSAGGGGVPAAAGADAAASGVDTTEQELKALFDSIDKDGSGAIDVEELQFALSVMGVTKSPEEVQELMDSVDKDGSGQLDFGEFTLILRTRLGVGGGSGGLVWTELADGSSSCELGPGGVLGEAALAAGQPLDGLVVAQEDSHLLLLEPAAYAATLADGFDGVLNAKAAVLKACPALGSCLARSDVRALAYAALSQRLGWGEQLYGAAGAAADALYVIQEGACRVIARTLVQVQGSAASRVAAPAEARLAADPSTTGAGAAGAAAALMDSPRQGLHSSRCSTVVRNIDVAVLGPGDLAGEAALLGVASGSTAVVVSSSQLVVLKLPQQQVQQLLHPSDLQRLTDFLQQREEQRQQRLVSGQLVAGAVSRAQQQLKAANTAANLALAPAGLVNGNELATAAGGGLQLPVLPSSAAAAAAAAIAATGGVFLRDLPSTIQQRKVDAVSLLLHDLVVLREDVEAENSAAGAAAVAAMAAAQTAAVTAAVAAATAAQTASNKALSAASAAFSSGASSSSRQKSRPDGLAGGCCCNSNSNPGGPSDSGSIAGIAMMAAMGVGVQGNLPCASAAGPSCSGHNEAAGEGVALAGPGIRLCSLVKPRANTQPCSSASCNGRQQQLLSAGDARQDRGEGGCSRSYRHQRVSRQPPSTATAAGTTAGAGVASGSGGGHGLDAGCCAGDCCSSSSSMRQRHIPCSSPESGHGRNSSVQQHPGSAGEAAGHGSTAPRGSTSSPGGTSGGSLAIADGQLHKPQQLDLGGSTSNGSNCHAWPLLPAAVVGWHLGATQRRHHHRRQLQQPPRLPASAPAAAARPCLAGQNLDGGNCVVQPGSSCCMALLAADGFFLTAPPEPQPLVLAAAAAVSAALQSLPSNSIRLLTARQRSSPRGSASPDCRLGQQRVPAVVSVELQRAGSSDTASQGAAASHRRRAAAAAASAKAAGGAGGPCRTATSPRDAVLRASTCSPRSSLCNGSGRSARPVAGGLFTPLDPGIRQAAEAAAESTSWSLGMQLLLQAQTTTAAACQQQQRHTHGHLGSRGGCASLNGNGSQQQQQQQQLATDRPRVLSVGESARGGTGSTSSPAGVSDGSAASLPSEHCSMMPTRPAVVPRLQLSRLQLVPPLLSALASNTQQQQLHASGATACVDAVFAGASLLPASLPGWRSALATRWTAGGRFGVATTTGLHAAPQAACKGSMSSRLSESVNPR